MSRQEHARRGRGDLVGTPTIWNGTAEEARELSAIISRNCACGTDKSIVTLCGPHVMLLSDQRALDGLLFVRQIVRRLLREELDPMALVQR
jgi:hypothetical protein